MSPLHRKIYPDTVTPQHVRQGSVQFTDDYDDRFSCGVEELAAMVEQLRQMLHKERLSQAPQKTPQPHERIILTLSNGYTLRSGGSVYELGAYVRICDKRRHEVVYWSPQEWVDAPEEVMGAVLGAILHPERCETLTRWSEQAQGGSSEKGGVEAGQVDEGDFFASVSPDESPGVEFPVGRWLREATDEAIRVLREISYGGYYLSDEVAQEVRDYDKRVSAVMAYCEAIDSGFTCSLPAHATERWIERYRPHLALPTGDCQQG